MKSKIAIKNRLIDLKEGDYLIFSSKDMLTSTKVLLLNEVADTGKRMYVVEYCKEDKKISTIEVNKEEEVSKILFRNHTTMIA